MEYSQDEETILGALFHESLCGGKLLLDHISLHYNDKVNQMVESFIVVEQERARFYTPKLSVEENLAPFRELGDKRILYIKLADRLHDLRTIKSFPALDQFRLSEETLWFLLPLSRSLGLEETSAELLRLSTKVLNQLHNSPNS